MTICHQCGFADEAAFLFCPRCGTRAPEGGDVEDSLIGRTLNDKYRIETEIGAGAMGTVYLAEHVGLKKKVALKVLHPDLQVSDESLRRFQGEGIATGKFNHPNLIQIFDFDKAAGRLFYLAMEYVEGSNLKVYLRRKGRLDPEHAMRISRQILSCLAEAHRHGIIHRDLKPDNIMIAPGPGQSVSVKVLDFGLSKLVDRPKDASLVTQQGRILGTPLYMAPEQCAGEEADTRSDLYAMGLMLYEMVTGLRPFPEESTTELLFTRATKDAPSILEEFPDLPIPKSLDELISRAMERRREDRFQTADEMMSALNVIRGDPSTWGAGSTIMTSVEALQRRRAERFEGLSAEGGPSGGAPQAGPRRGRWPLVLLAVVAASVGGFFLLRSGSLSLPEPMLVSMIRVDRLSNDQLLYLDDLESARKYLRQGNYSAARSEVDSAAERQCADAEVELVKGEIFREQGDWSAARESYRRALEAEPTYYQASVGLGWVECESGRYSDSLSCFEAAAEYAGDDITVLTGLGAAAFGLRAYDRALEYLDRACEDDPNNAEANLYRGKLLMKLSELETRSADKVEYVGRAIEALVKAKVSDARSEEIKRTLVSAYLAAEDHAKAERELLEALEIFDNVEFLQDLGALYLDDGRNEEALALLSRAVERHPTDGWLAVLHGLALAGLDRNAEAIAEIDRGLEREDYDPEATLLLASLYHGEGQLEAAADKYNEALELLGQHSKAAFELGVVYFQMEDYEDAMRSFHDAIEWGIPRLGGRSSDVTEAEEHVLESFKNLGILHMNFGDDESDAIDYFERYTRLGGADPRVPSWIRELRGG